METFSLLLLQYDMRTWVALKLHYTFRVRFCGTWRRNSVSPSFIALFFLWFRRPKYFWHDCRYIRQSNTSSFPVCGFCSPLAWFEIICIFMVRFRSLFFRYWAEKYLESIGFTGRIRIGQRMSVLIEGLNNALGFWHVKSWYSTFAHLWTSSNPEQKSNST